MTELSDSQKIRVIKAILDDEIAAYSKAVSYDNQPRTNERHQLSKLGIREDTLITLREKLKILDEFK